jgi:hypothetical protein
MNLFYQVLQKKEGDRKEIRIDEVRGMYGDSQSLISLISSTMLDASFIIKLMCELNVMPLALQITNIAGMYFQDVNVKLKKFISICLRSRECRKFINETK